MKKTGKSPVLMFCIIFLLAIVMAQGNKMEVSTIKESFKAGEKITFKVSLYDHENNLIDAEVNVSLEDAEKKVKLEETVPSNKLVDMDLGENAPNGYWKITAKYQDIEATGLFYVEINELARFDLENDVLTVTNVGNTKYSRNIQIIIGDTIGVKKVELGIGEKIKFRLIAPDGTYNVRVTDGKTSISKSGVVLTGEVVGILDERLSERSPLTGGIKPGEVSEVFSLRKSSFIYVFLVVVLGGIILLTIEKRVRKKAIESQVESQ